MEGKPKFQFKFSENEDLPTCCIQIVGFFKFLSKDFLGIPGSQIGTCTLKIHEYSILY